MELRDYIVAGINDAHRMVGFAMDDLTPEVAHFEPGGTSNTIAQILAHMTMTEDSAVNRMLSGGQPIIEAEGWYAKTGIPEGRGAVWQKDWTLNLDAFREYQAKVAERSNAYFAALDPAELDREVEAFNGPRPVSSVILAIIIDHTLGHCGEISAIKGVQGLKGLPY